MGYLQDAELGLPWEGKPIEAVLADQQAQNVRLLKRVSTLEQQLAEAKRALEEIDQLDYNTSALDDALLIARAVLAALEPTPDPLGNT